MASGKPPITRHPLFPATVALWFGALFGIGSLAVRPALIESAILALKLDALIAVPIGPTTRILIALALAGAGGLLGARLARRIGQPKPVPRPRKRGADFSARGAAGQTQPVTGNAATSPVLRTGRRAQLAIPDDGHGEPQYYDRAPVPGSAQILDVSQFDIEGFEPEPPQNVDQDSLQVSEATLETLPSAGDETTEEPAFLPGPAYDETPPAIPQAPFVPATSPILPRLSGEHAPAVPPAAPEAAAPARPPFDRVSPAPSLFAQPFNAKVSEIRWQDDTTRDADQPEQPGTSAAERIASAQLDDLAPIELLERLAISLREKRSRAALPASPLSSDAQAPTASDEDQPAGESPDNITGPDLSDEEDEPEADADVIATVAPPVPAIPAALQPVGLYPEDDEDDLPSFIPPRRIGGTGQAYSAPVAPSVTFSPAPEATEADPTETANSDPDLEQGYSSLLNLSRAAPLELSAGQRYVRIEEPEPSTGEIEPVVVFPSQMSASTPQTGETSGSADSNHTATPDSAAKDRDAEETERALRSALANIQRMSGAA